MAESIIADLAELFADTVTIEPFVSSTGFGVVTYGAAVTRQCRIKGEHKIVRDSAGREKVSTVQVWLAGAFGVTAKDRVTLPARFSPQQPVPISVEEVTDENGPHHERIMF